MLPRAKSIFHLGEEGGHEASKTSRTCCSGESHSSKREPERLVGLRILIQHPGRMSNVVIKPAVKARGPEARVHRSSKSSTVPEPGGFLKACYLCKRELSPHKDVYMYRGDQGFCSIECRCRQILLDERGESEASVRERLAGPRHRRTGINVQDSDRRRRISVAA